MSAALAGYNAGEGAVKIRPPDTALSRDTGLRERISARYAAISNLKTGLYASKTDGAMRPRFGQSAKYKPDTIAIKLNNGRTGLSNK